MRSLLLRTDLQPGAIEAALRSGADALALDLSSAGEPARIVLPASLRNAAAGPGRPAILVRVSALRSGRAEAEIAALPADLIDGVILSAECRADVQHLGALLAVAEAKAGRLDGAVRIVSVVANGRALLELASVAQASSRLCAIAWDGDAFAADIGAAGARDPGGDWIEPCRHARTLTLAAAAAAGLPAIDAASHATDLDVVRWEAENARSHGFGGKFVHDATEAAIVNEVFGEPQTG